MTAHRQSVDRPRLRVYRDEPNDKQRQAEPGHLFPLDDTPAIHREPPPRKRRRKKVWTLARVFEEHVRPDLFGRSKETLAEYRRHLERFLDFAAAYKPQAVPDSVSGTWTRETAEGTKEPVPELVVKSIDVAMLKAFRLSMQEECKADGSSRWTPRTINKHVGSVLTVLRAAQEARIVSHVPRMKRLATPQAGGSKLYLQYDEVSKLYEACDVACWPKGLSQPAPVWWRSGIVHWFNFGFRTEELIAYTRRHDSLTWDCVIWDTCSPAIGSRLENKWGWIKYTPQKQRWAKDEPLVLPLNEVCHRHLRAIEPAGLSDEQRKDSKVFPFPLSPDQFYATWSAIRYTAGVRPPAGAKDDEYQVKHLRKTCTTWHEHACRGIAQFITGHAEERDLVHARNPIVAKHYDNAEHAVRDHMQTFPQPEAFLAIAE